VDAGRAEATSAERETDKEYRGASSVHAIEFNAKRSSALTGFWQMDGGVEDGLKHEVRKPDKETKCPTTMKKLRMKDLLTVKWTRVRAGESGKYMCPITYKTFTNATTIVVLKPNGVAMSEEGYKTVVEKEGAYDGQTIRPDKDVIKLQKGGTGFAGSGTQVESKAEFELGVGGGGELRGQSRGAQSKFGLRFA
jgi:nitric oxide synthase-interacting protein